MSSDFRQMNVDQYDEDVLTAADLQPLDARSPQEMVHAAHAKQSGVRARLARCVFFYAKQQWRHGGCAYRSAVGSTEWCAGR